MASPPVSFAESSENNFFGGGGGGGDHHAHKKQKKNSNWVLPGGKSAISNDTNDMSMICGFFLLRLSSPMASRL